MLAALVLASLWAQAEQAPPPAAPPPPAPPPAPIPANGLRVNATFAYRFDSGAGAELGPQAGFSLGVMFERRTLAVSGGRGELGVALDASYTRFSTSVEGSAMVAPGQEMTYAAERTQSLTSFALLQTAGCPVGRSRPFAGIGAGVAIGYFSSPELDLRPGSASAAMPLGRALVGVDIVVSPAASLTVRASYSHTFARPTFTTETGTSYALFGSVVDVGAGMAVRF
jgi:hypothetical protein